MTLKIIFDRSGESPRDISSSIRNLFWAINALAMATIRCSPPLREPAIWRVRFFRTGKIE